MMRPQLPRAEQLVPYLERIDQARYYSNHGTLLREFEQRLAQHFGVDTGNVAVVANGTVALSAALLAAGAAPGTKCLVPSWTFVASASAIWAANMRPHFIDVSSDTWMLDPDAVKSRDDLHEVGAVMVVSPFGAPVDTQAWDAFQEETGIPVIIDGAAAFDTVASISAARPGKSPIMVSLHATKVFGVGEGGVLVSTDTQLMRRFHQICNFGVWGEGGGQILGYNGKLSEYHCAVGLAFFDMWDERRKALEELTARYSTALRSMPETDLVPGYGDGWISCYCNVQVHGDLAAIIRALESAGIETRRWWRTGVHRQTAYEGFTRDELPVTERLASGVFGLPFYHDMTASDVNRVLAALAAALREASPA